MLKPVTAKLGTHGVSLVSGSDIPNLDTSSLSLDPNQAELCMEVHMVLLASHLNCYIVTPFKQMVLEMITMCLLMFHLLSCC